jgi:hypothetical protein
MRVVDFLHCVSEQSSRHCSVDAPEIKRLWHQESKANKAESRKGSRNPEEIRPPKICSDVAASNTSNKGTCTYGDSVDGLEESACQFLSHLLSCFFFWARSERPDFEQGVFTYHGSAALMHKEDVAHETGCDSLARACADTLNNTSREK